MDTNISITLPESIDNAIKNVSEQPTMNIGQTISDCLFLVFGNINQRANLKRIKYELELNKFREDLEHKMNSIPEDKRIEPNVQTVCTAMENMRYCVCEDELRKMFASLIANSIDADKTEYVHPSYGEIIKQLTSFDAKLFSTLINNRENPTLMFKIIDNDSETGDYVLFPYCFIKSEETNIDSLQISIDNLRRLNLINVNMKNRYADKTIYEKMENLQSIIDAKKFIEENAEGNNRIEYVYGILNITEFGKNFYKACN